MTTRRKILSRALALAALTAFGGAAVASASPSRTPHAKHIVGRVASISATGFTINGKALAATSRQLAGLVEGQCVEAKARLSNGRAAGRARHARGPLRTLGEGSGGDRSGNDGSRHHRRPG